MNDTLEVITLGGLDIRAGGETVTGFESRKVEALLVYLACNARPQSRDVLADLLWENLSQTRAMANLRRALFDLRQHVGPYLEITRHTVALNPDCCLWLDVAVLEGTLDDALEQGRLTSPTAVEQAERALSFYKGDFLKGFHVRAGRRFEEWMRLEQARLRELVVETLHELMAHHLDNGAYKNALAHARRLLELDPWSEGAHRGVMVCLASNGQRTAALAQYEICRSLLAEELGVEPEAETTALYEQIRMGEIVPPVRAPAAPQHNLPSQATPFVGRAEELARIARRLDEAACRLLTLVGPGGCGKTRLAIEAAQRLVDGPCANTQFTHGVFFIPLVAVSAPESIVSAIADVLDVPFFGQADPREQLTNYLRRKSLLLVLDSFEHLLGASPPQSPPRGGMAGGAHLVSQILAAAPGVKILVTSRVALNLHGEWFHPVAGMSFPTVEAAAAHPETDLLQEYSAIALFVQSARRARPGFSLSQQLRGVSRICQLVEGVPLAIELAAAWLKLFPSARIAQEIEQNLDFLTTSLRDVPARHRSMRAVFDHSWRLLTEDERSVLKGLSIFRGGFRAAAADAVTKASLPTLAGLVEKSLLHQTPESRYQMHELLRQFAAEKLQATLPEKEQAHDRHSAYYTSLLQERGEALKGAEQKKAMAELDVEIGNASAAWNWAVEHLQVQRLDQAVSGLCYYFVWRGRYQEAEGACQTAANKLAADKLDEWNVVSPAKRPVVSNVERLHVWAHILAWQSFVDQYLGHGERAIQRAEQSLAFLKQAELTDQKHVLSSRLAQDGPESPTKDTRAVKAFALVQLGDAVEDAGSYEYKQLYEQSLALYRTMGDRWGVAKALQGLSMAAINSGDVDEARQMLQESLSLRRELGDRRGTIMPLVFLCSLSSSQGQLEEAECWARESVTVGEEVGDRTYLGTVRANLGWVLQIQGRLAEARAVFQEGLQCLDALESPILNLLHLGLGSLNAHQALYERARSRAKMGLALARETGHGWHIARLLCVLGNVALAQKQPIVARECFQESADVLGTRWHRFDIVWSLAGLAYAARDLGDQRQSQVHVNEAIRLAIEMHAFHGLITALPLISLLLADQGNAEWTVELYSLASRYPIVANSRWFEDVAGKQIAAVAATLPPDVVAAARERGQARDLWETAEELLEELQ